MTTTTTTTTTTREPVCYGQTITHNCVQEWYETTTRDAGRRAKALRSAGYRVVVAGMGLQVTNVGLVKMTLLTAYGDYDQMCAVPAVRIVRV